MNSNDTEGPRGSLKRIRLLHLGSKFGCDLTPMPVQSIFAPFINMDYKWISSGLTT
jgi:hypothetical protein